MPEWTLYLALLAAGVVAGALNVIAGGGSFLTLPILIFLGLPSAVANGTNRVGILTQNVAAVWSFSRHRVMRWQWALWVAVPAALGASLGTWAALEVGEQLFKRLLALFMVVLTLWSLWDPLRSSERLRRAEEGGEVSPALGPLLAVAFFGVGLYGGFVQAGVGFLILAAITLAGLDLVRGNAVKVLVVLIFTPISLGIFAWQGKVDWPLGLVLAAGTTLGGWLGARLTLLKGHRWVKGVVTLTALAFAVKLWIAP